MRKSLLVLAVATVVLMISTPAMADVIWTAGSFTYNANIVSGGGGYDITFKATNGTGSTAYFQGFGLKNVFGSAVTTPASLTNAADFSPVTFALGLNTGFNNGNGNCNGSGGELCLNPNNGVNYNAQGSNTLTFKIHLSGGSPLSDEALWHLQTFSSPCQSGSGPNCGNLGAISDTGGVTTPEPASLALLSVGLLGLGGLFKRRK